MAEKIGIRPATITLKGSKVLLVKSLYEEEEFFLFPGGGLEFGEKLICSEITKKQREILDGLKCCA